MNVKESAHHNVFSSMKIVLGTLRRLINEVLLLEDRVSDAKKKYPELEAEIDELASSDPSGSQKYLMWSAKQLSAGADVNELISTIESFHQNASQFKNRDINAYKTLGDLKDELNSITPSKTHERKEAKESGAKKMGEDNGYELVHIKSKAAAQLYGANTQWCITMNGMPHFEQYTGANIVFYFALSKTLPDTDPLYKVAFAVHRDENNKIIKVEGWDAEDEKFDEIPSEFNGLLRIVEQDAPKQETSLLAKIKLGKATEEEIEQALELYDDEEDILIMILNSPRTPSSVLARYINFDSRSKLRVSSSRIREIVAARIDPSYLPKMMKDRDNDVRQEVARRIDPSHLPRMMYDPSLSVQEIVVRRIDPEFLPNLLHIRNVPVRLEIAHRIDVLELPKMMDDMSTGVRAEVARRIDPERLPEMIDDESAEVRRIVAERIDAEHLIDMIEDDDYYVRSIVAGRTNTLDLPHMMKDEDALVRMQVALRIDPKYLPMMKNDANDRVRNTVRDRLEQIVKS